MSKQVRACRYLRVSKQDQNPQLQDFETDRFIESKGWNLVETVVDHGVSGAKDRRPGLDRMLAAAAEKQFDVVVCWRSDRLFRSLKHMVVTLDDLAKVGVGFSSATEVFDTTSPTGRLMLHLVSAFAEFERSVIIERTKAGVAAARRRGAQIGRPKKDFDLGRARLLREEGRTLKEISARLDDRNVLRLIGNPARVEVDVNVPSLGGLITERGRRHRVRPRLDGIQIVSARSLRAPDARGAGAVRTAISDEDGRIANV